MANTIISNIGIISNVAADLYTATESPTGSDLANYAGNMLAHINVGVSSTGTLAVTVQHNDVATSGDGGWADIPAAALVDPATGAPATFASYTDTAAAQTLEVVRERCKRYIRFVLTIGASGEYEAVGTFTGLQRYAS